MLPQFNAIVLDVIMVVALLSLIAIGVFKGVKHTLINIGLLIVSLVLGFMPFTNVVKVYIAQLLAKIINIGNNVSYSAEGKIAMSSLYMFMAALILSLLVYVIARLVKLIIIRVYRKKNGIGRVDLTVLSRVFGGVASFFIHGFLVILLLSVADNPLVGMDKTLDNSFVTKYVTRVDDIIIDACGGNSQNVEANITILALKGNVLAKVNENDIAHFIGMADALGKQTLAPKSMDMEEVQRVVDNMEHILLLQESLFAGDKGVPLGGYEEMMSLTKDALNKAISQMSSMHGGAEKIAGIDNAFSVASKLEKLYGVTLADKFSEMFIL